MRDFLTGLPPPKQSKKGKLKRGKNQFITPDQKDELKMRNLQKQQQALLDKIQERELKR